MSVLTQQHNYGNMQNQLIVKQFQSPGISAPFHRSEPKIYTHKNTHPDTVYMQKNILQEYKHISMVVILQWVMQCSGFL